MSGWVGGWADGRAGGRVGGWVGWVGWGGRGGHTFEDRHELRDLGTWHEVEADGANEQVQWVLEAALDAAPQLHISVVGPF